MKNDFIGPAYKGRSIGVDAQECVNLYIEENAGNSKNKWSLIGTPGYSLFSRPGSGVFRGIYSTARDRLFAVYGTTLYEVLPDKSSSVLGTFLTHSGKVQFAEVQTSAEGYSSQVMAADGVHGYVYDSIKKTFTELTSGYLSGTSLTSIGNRFVQTVNDSGKVIFSKPYSATFDPLDFIVTEGLADRVLSCHTINNELWILGTKSLEIWTQTGDLATPFVRSGIGFINIGTTGKYSACTINNQLLWLGNNNTVWQASGYVPTRVSTHAVEYIIGQMSVVSDAVAYQYQDEGHQFFILNFPTGNRTLAYDLITQMWHERASYDSLTGSNNRHRMSASVNWNGMVMCGDYDNNGLYHYSLDKYTDNGSLIKRVRAAAHQHEDRKRIFYNSFELDYERGTGLLSSDGTAGASGHLLHNVNTGQGENPQIMMQWSDDGGYTWSSEHWMSAGRIGARLTRARLTRLGMSRDRIFKATMTDPVKWVIIDARMDASIEA